MLSQCPNDMDPTLPPHLFPHQSLGFHTPAAHNPYAPAAPSRYTSYATLNPPYASSSLPITILILSQCPPKMPLTLLPHQPNPQRHLPSLCSCHALKMILQCPPISALTTPYAFPPLPHLLCRLQSLCSRGALKICLQCHP
ncbi:hypothetical protein O181_016485 [Austropuccinia psidii MF-1]|uniref:Uncharacterized protein n=1 Tax=Austropuccinia psidii MF-1 TaxID=1389203 RepID=A0A9Q3GS09_9BASI|nr:hypothetical protein [Austropuccinia psidii MF-1]